MKSFMKIIVMMLFFASTVLFTACFDGDVSAKSIKTFTITSPLALGKIDEHAKTIEVIVPGDTDVTNLIPIIIYNGASISPKSGESQNFTNPVIYTVTAEDGSTQEYKVSVIKEVPSSEKKITSFTVKKPYAKGKIDESTKTIKVVVPSGTDVTNLDPMVTHHGAFITPKSDTFQDFTNSVIYTVTAEDGSEQEYTVIFEFEI